jgi:hypothetical protein
MSVLTEYSNFLLVLILVFYLLLNSRSSERRILLVSFGALILGGLVSALFLAFYNSTNFGSPLRLSYSYAVNYPWAGSFATTFNFPLVAGLKGLLIGGTGDGWCDGPCANQGLFLLSPILLLALPGWFFYYRAARRECLLTAVLFLTYLLLFARHRTFHGFTADGRYLMPFLGLLAIPLAFTLQRLYDWRAQPALRAILFFIVLGLFAVSARNIFVHIGTSYNYQLDPTLLGTPDSAFQALGQVFRNTANLALLWLFEVAMVLLALGAAIGLHKARVRYSEPPG